MILFTEDMHTMIDQTIVKAFDIMNIDDPIRRTSIFVLVVPE